MAKSCQNMTPWGYTGMRHCRYRKIGGLDIAFFFTWILTMDLGILDLGKSGTVQPAKSTFWRLIFKNLWICI